LGVIKPAGQGCAGSLMAEMEQHQHCEYLDSYNKHIVSLDSYQCQKPPFEPYTSLSATLL